MKSKIVKLIEAKNIMVVDRGGEMVFKGYKHSFIG